jgi:membrane-associated phospholipid phosphatase
VNSASAPGTRLQPPTMRLYPVDIVLLLGNAALSLVVLFNRARLPDASALLAAHAAIFAGVFMIARLEAMRQARWATLIHPWLPVPLIPVAYFELGLLIPVARETAPYSLDHALQAVDVRLLGDPLLQVEQIASAPLSDLLMACYVGYYLFPCLLLVKLYQRTNLTAFHSAMTSMAWAFALTYVGYFMFPAMGPHVLFDAYRPAALDGYVLAGPAYQALLQTPNEPPDAFPSGHALIGALVPVLAWRWQRRWFPWLAPLGAGMVAATVYFRFHYIADVVVALVLVPICCWLGDVLVSYSLPASDVGQGNARPQNFPVQTKAPRESVL